MNPEPKGTVNGVWMPTLVFSEETGVTREKLLTNFSSENIDARVFFWPLSSLDMFETAQSNIHAYSISGRAINLPSYHDMNDEEIDRVTTVIRKNMTIID